MLLFSNGVNALKVNDLISSGNEHNGCRALGTDRFNVNVYGVMVSDTHKARGSASPGHHTGWC